MTKLRKQWQMRRHIKSFSRNKENWKKCNIIKKEMDTKSNVRKFNQGLWSNIISVIEHDIYGRQSVAYKGAKQL
jgi:hypothetical protein